MGRGRWRGQGRGRGQGETGRYGWVFVDVSESGAGDHARDEMGYIPVWERRKKKKRKRDGRRRRDGEVVSCPLWPVTDGGRGDRNTADNSGKVT